MQHRPGTRTSRGRRLIKFLSTVYYFFTPYTDAREQAVGRFFKRLNEHGNRTTTQAKLGKLLQSNAAVINLWTEYRYKGYKYLKKPERKKLYANLQLISLDFHRFYTTQAKPAEAAIGHFRRVTPGTTASPDRAVLVQALMDYFSPSRGVYEYRESSSFGRLLRDPSHEKLIGDCNQMVTLYMHLYSQYFSIQDLRVHTMPGHVALHYGGVDIETTNGTLADYGHKVGNVVLPVEEIVSINLLDTTDSYLSTHEVAAEDILQASRLAFILSHNRDIATNNLKAAYSRLINSLMERNNYSRALEFASASRDMTLLNAVGHNGAVHEMQHNNFAAARRFAQHALKRDELVHSSWHAEGVHHYKNHRYHDAIKAFKNAGKQELVQSCYEALFFEEQNKLGSGLNSVTIKNHASTIKHMRTYAKQSGNKKLVKYADNLNSYL